MATNLEKKITPYKRVLAPTQSDTVNQPEGPCRGILSTAAGTATVVFSDNNTYQITFAAPGAAGWATGVWHYIEFKRINDTNTSLANSDLCVGI